MTLAQRRFDLPAEEMPKRYYNILPDLPVELPPPLNPATQEPVGPADLEPLFPKAIIQQEVSSERYIPIPEAVREAYVTLNRPTPLFRATRLEEALNTPARIYYKYEGVNPTGSHKPNTAIAQAYYAAQEGVERLTTETGAGQWGSALALAGSLFDLDVTVFMVRISYDQKPYRRIVMNTYGATVHPSPSPLTPTGQKILKEDPDSTGSLGIAISEAVETAVQDDATKYSLGSVLNHVLLHQTVIGQEAQVQLEMADAEPDYLVGCVGGGSNFAGFSYPFIKDVLAGESDAVPVAVEADVVPSLTGGEYRYDFGDTGERTPLVKMYTLGHDFVPPGIHAGGLRYHGDAPSLSLLVDQGVIQARSFHQLETFEAGTLFAQTEGIIPAPESNHAVKGAIALAQEAKRDGEERTIVFNLSGHGLLDLQGYGDFQKGELE